MSTGSNTMIVNSTVTYENRISRDILKERVATGAFHNSKELYDAPKCHPHTRVAVLDDIMQWVNESESAEDFMMWLFGPAGAGKSAIAKKIAEIAAERDLLLADFFFSKSSSSRNTTDRLIATLAYQLALSIPGTRYYIEDAVEQDPVIFDKSVPTQIDTLLIKPYLFASPTRNFPSQKLIIIDGLDECNDRKSQVAILAAISSSFPQHNLPIKFLLVSRPEPDIVTSFNCHEPLKDIHRRLALDDTYKPDEDIRRFFSDKFEDIKRTHLLRSTIPISWPAQELLDILVKKSSGQFIYASTVIKFVESSCHKPTERLNIILGISPPGKTNPFAELDALYNHLLSSVDDIQLTLHVLSFYVMTPELEAQCFYHGWYGSDNAMSRALFLSIAPGDARLALINLSSIVSYLDDNFDPQSGDPEVEFVEVLHASFVDFPSDKRRSTTFYIDKASTCTGFLRRILQCVKGPDGIRAGDIRLFRGVNKLGNPDGQLQSDISNFDIDAFINASIKCYYNSLEHRLSVPGCTVEAIKIWKEFLTDSGLEYGGALDRLNKSFDSRLQIYQSDWRFKLLLPIAASGVWKRGFITIPFCRYVDILLEMDDHCYLHLVDQHALDLCHTSPDSEDLLEDIVSHLDGDAYAAAALHCMRFLSNPPKYSERNERPDLGLIYPEWRATCKLTIDILCALLEEANTLPDLVQFISKHDIHPEVQNHFSADRIWKVNQFILDFLGRADVCDAIQRSRNRTYQLSGDWSSKKDHYESDYDEAWITVPYFMRQRLDLCCSNIHNLLNRG